MPITFDKKNYVLNDRHKESLLAYSKLACVFFILGMYTEN